MKIENALKTLKSYTNDEEILIWWWDIDPYKDLYNITKEEWKKVIDKLDEYSFDSISETVHDAIQTELEIIRGENESKTIN